MNKWNKIRKTDLKSLGEVPMEISENIKAPELAPKDNRFTGRNKRIAFTCRPEFAEELRKMAFEKNCYQIEVLEKAVEVYKKSLLANSETKNSEVKPRPNHNISQPINKSPINDEDNKETANSCSFFGQDEKTQTIIYLNCDKPLFDKKKRLCHSHSRQVRNKFNKFLQNQSIGSSAAWEMSWEQSSDWWHFWNLAEKEKVDE